MLAEAGGAIVRAPGRGNLEARRAGLNVTEGGQAIQYRNLIAMASGLDINVAKIATRLAQGTLSMKLVQNLW